MPSSGPDAWFRGFREGMSEVGPGDPGTMPSWDRYELGERIGHGGAAEVFRARDRQLGREVAIKVLHESLGSSPTVRERFQREAKVTAGLSHPGILTIYDAGEAGGRLYLVMELVDGRPLSELLAERTYDVKAMVRLLEQVARGVAAAHEQGIIHRDLKPGNILVSRSGEAKVADFGLAHIAGAETALTRQGTVMGTPLYMAAEQVQGRTTEIGVRTDVYALGVILYEILTGRPPHIGESVTEIYGRILNDDPAAPRRLNPRVARDLETIALKALEKEPDRRYAGATAFADDLRRYLDGEPILASAPGTLTIVRKWTRRHRTVAAVAVVIVLSVGILIGGAVKRRFDKEREIDSLLEAGRKARADHERLVKDLLGLRTREQELLAAIAPDAPDEQRDPLWKVQKQIADAEKAAETRDDDSLTAFTSAYAIDPSDPAPKKELAAHYFREFQEAESEGDGRGVERNIRSLGLYDDGTFRREIDREVPVSIDSRPSGAAVELLQYEEGPDRRRVEIPVKTLGKGPVTVNLKAGAWLFILHHPGYREVRLPVSLERGRECRLEIDLYSEEEIGAEFVYIPAGPFIFGGDPPAKDPAERRIATIDGFFVSRLETTFSEYCEFLTALLREGKREEAQDRYPRRSDSPADRAVLQPGARKVAPATEADAVQPMDQISWNDAVAYAAWRSAQSPRREVFRLPTEEEWEKAARGADARAFPWGSDFDISFPNVSAIKENGRCVLGPVGAAPKDRSPYGALDMAGGVQECCAGTFRGDASTHPVRGGTAGMRTPGFFRSASRFQCVHDAPGNMVGFRLVKELPRR